MPTWNHTVSLAPYYHSDMLSLQEKGKLVAKELRKLMQRSFKDDYDLLGIIESFEYIISDEDIEDDFTPVEDFNARMFDLYEFADYNRIWISTRG